MENKKPYQNLGAKIRERRNSLDRAIKEMSVDIGVDRTYLSKVENGQIKPSLGVLDKVIKYLGFEMSDTLDLYKMAGYSGEKVRFEGNDKAEILHNPNEGQVTNKDKEAARILVPDNVNILYTDSIFLTTGQFGVVLDVAQKLAATNQHKIIARLGMSDDHAKALRDLLIRKLKEKK